MTEEQQPPTAKSLQIELQNEKQKYQNLSSTLQREQECNEQLTTKLAALNQEMSVVFQNNHKHIVTLKSWMDHTTAELVFTQNKVKELNERNANKREERKQQIEKMQKICDQLASDIKWMQRSSNTFCEFHQKNANVLKNEFMQLTNNFEEMVAAGETERDIRLNLRTVLQQKMFFSGATRDTLKKMLNKIDNLQNIAYLK